MQLQKLYTTSEITFKLIALNQLDLIKSNTVFWKSYFYENIVEDVFKKNEFECNKIIEDLKELFNREKIFAISPFDEKFPTINSNVKKDSEKPFILYLKGNIDLLANLNKNVAVVGLTTPSKTTIERGIKVLNHLVINNVIVSGLALGCDSLAHEVCVKTKSKTVAILPCEITTIIPKSNKKLAEDILKENGLLMSEYLYPAKNSFESINRFIQRDRLQAMFSKAILLISSYRKSDKLDEKGKKFDSGSRHALNYAKNYEIKRYVMFDKKTDLDDPQFELNKDLLNDGCSVFTLKSIQEINELSLTSLIKEETLF